MNAILRTGLVLLLAFGHSACGDKGGGETPSTDKAGNGKSGAPPGLMTAPPTAPPAPKPFKRHPPETVLITVNDKELTQADLDEVISARFRGMPADSPQLAPILGRMMPQIEKQLIDQALLEQAADEAGTAPGEEEVLAKFEELVKTRLPKDADVDAELKKQNLTRQEVYDDIRSGMAIEKLIEQQPGVKNPTDEEVRAHYDANLLSFQTPERVKARHILLKVEPKATPEQKAEKREAMEALLARLKAGESEFSELAKEHSACPSSAKGGDLGFFGRGQMVPEFDKAAFDLEVGGLSDIVETQFGFHVITLDERKEAGTKPFEEVSESIKSKMSSESRRKAVTDLLTALRDKATIVRAELDDK